MEETEIETTDPAAMREAIIAQDGCLFACLDVAPFDNLQAELMGTGLDFKPLWPEDEDAFALAEGPHLVVVPGGDARENAVDELLEIMENHPQAAVWWTWPGHGPSDAASSGDVPPQLFAAVERHLRSLAMVEVPIDRFDADKDDLEEYHQALTASQSDPSIPPPSPWEAVFFRHFDADIMASLLPLLDIAQFSRLFGDATGLLMQAPDFNGLNEAPRPDDMPPKPAGLLRLSQEQYEELSKKQAHRARLEILRFLRENADEETEDLTDSELMAKIVEAEKAGYGLGLESNEAHSLYAFVAIGTNGESLKSREIIRTFDHSDVSPDATMKAMFDQMITAAEADPEPF